MSYYVYRRYATAYEVKKTGKFYVVITKEEYKRLQKIDKFSVMKSRT